MERRRQGITESHESELTTKSGNRITILLSTSTITDENGDYLGALAVVTDITERKQAEEALREANKKLNLLSSITRHDINNQLMVIQGYLTLLEENQPGPIVIEKFRKHITAAAERISSMIQFTKEYENIGVHSPVWQDTRALADVAVRQAPLGQVQVCNDLPTYNEVFADPLIGKVFSNLMDNAVRHGGKVRTIRFFLEEAGGSQVIVCEDDGAGIPADEKERIFERGFGKNTGYGLFLAREILAITGITIHETGEPGKGARFEITVPGGMWRNAGERTGSSGTESEV